MDRVTVNVVSASLNIGQESTKMFPKYSRSIIHMHKYHVTPPVYIYVDVRYQGNKDSPALGACHLIAYGIGGNQSSLF